MSGYCSRDCLPCTNDCGLAGKPNPTLAEAFPATVCPTCGSDKRDDWQNPCDDKWHDGRIDTPAPATWSGSCARLLPRGD